MKAILVIDMPKSCEECRIRFSGEPNEWCWVVKHGIDDVEEKPSWCPLKPLPAEFKTYKLSPRDQEETELLINMAMIKVYADGWNDCLKEIEE